VSERVSNEGIARRLAEDFPMLWEIAEKHDFAERLGGSTDPLTREVDAALRELWDWRRTHETGLLTVDEVQGILTSETIATPTEGES
jgi:hypothetical protein